MTTPLAVVTGATGFIATRLVPVLTDNGWRVRATARRPRPEWMDPAVEYQPVDLAGDDAGALTGLCAGATHVFHLAGASSSKSSQEEMDRDNILATDRLLQAAAAGPLERFVHMSSTAVYGEEVQLPSPVSEDVEPHSSRATARPSGVPSRRCGARSTTGCPRSSCAQ